ncbi:MAG: porphobilinogen synthase [Candidatus Latescibacterota bacterium]|nr:MAG: porphobilinogen synthase [Candidatus Latescibacterota bacterium]
MPFPIERLRRLRRTPGLRRMVRETRLTLDGLIEPHFACPGEHVRRDVASMPGCAQMSVDVLVEECKRSFDLGIPSIILFGIPSAKDAVGSEGYARDGIVPRAIEAVKKGVPDLVVWADVCMCEYTDHGHCGVLKGEEVDNDATLPLLAKAALTYAQAGADGVAPSDMMDGRVTAIRETLDESGYQHIPIMSYAAKFASAFYGPFRDAAESTPQFGDRRAYQMDPPNAREALHEMELDLDEGADILMVKPALAYLDIIRQARDRFDVPIACYNVSGEFSMVKAAARNDWIDEDRIILEMLTAFHRAGADIILTYFARDAARLLRA